MRAGVAFAGFHACHNFEKGRFSTAIFGDERHLLPLIHLQVDVAEKGLLAVTFGNIFECQVIHERVVSYELLRGRFKNLPGRKNTSERSDLVEKFFRNFSTKSLLSESLFSVTGPEVLKQFLREQDIEFQQQR